MLLVNLSDYLVNGLKGSVKNIEDDGPTVYFPQANKTLKLKSHTFSVFSKQKMKDVGFRRQIPLNLAFGLTVHKAQGMTMDRVVVDCRHMHTPGQIGVAIGRAKCKKGLRVLNFTPSLLKVHPKCITDFYSAQSPPPMPDFSCCRKCSKKRPLVEMPDVQGPPQIFECDTYDLWDDFSEADLPTEEDLNLILESEDVASLDTTLEETSLPEEISVDDLICNIMHEFPETDQQKQENDVCQYLRDNIAHTEEFMKHLWKAETDNFKDTLDKDSVVLSDIKTFYTMDFRYLSSDTYLKNVEKLFGKKPRAEHSNVCYKLARTMRQSFLKLKVDPIIEAEKGKTHSSTTDYRQSDAGRGTIRYIGGWCVATLKHKKKQSIRRKLYKSAWISFIQKVNGEVRYLELLECNSYDILQISTDAASLKETQRRQNDTGGLTNISDAAFNFFTNLDKKIRSQETKGNIQLFGKEFYPHITDQILKDVSLIKEWKELFQEDIPDSDKVVTISEIQSKNPFITGLLSPPESEPEMRKKEINNHEVIEHMYQEVCNKYIRMSCGQFRKEYLREIKADKHEAHRKQIRMRTEKKGQAKAQFNYDFILQDQSVGKISSHRRLQSEIETNPNSIENVFKKCELFNLCKAYRMDYNRASTKSVISGALIKVVLGANEIPSPFHLTTNADEPSSSNLSELDTDQTPATAPATAPTTAPDPTPDPTPDPRESKPAKGKRKGKGKGKAPKKKTVEYPCGICFHECVEMSIACDLCDTWFHYNCAGLSAEDVEMLEGKDLDWHCSVCKS